MVCIYSTIILKSFGSQKACNHLVKYVVFVIAIRAIAPWLGTLFIMYLIITASALLVSFGVIIYAYVKRRRIITTEHPAAAESRPPVPSPTPQSQGQQEQESDLGRMAVRNFSVV